MLHLAGLFAFSLPAWLPGPTTPVGIAVWSVLVVVGVAVLVALAHVLYVAVCGLTFVYLWFKGIVEERGRRENR